LGPIWSPEAAQRHQNGGCQLEQSNSYLDFPRLPMFGAGYRFSRRQRDALQDGHVRVPDDHLARGDILAS
jgi:hypothetical protein